MPSLSSSEINELLSQLGVFSSLNLDLVKSIFGILSAKDLISLMCLSKKMELFVRQRKEKNKEKGKEKEKEKERKNEKEKEILKKMNGEKQKEKEQKNEKVVEENSDFVLLI